VEEREMITKIIKAIKDRLSGEFKCPAYWWEQGLEDCDEGCHIDFEMDCCNCKYRFYPKFLIKKEVNEIIKSENDYWEEKAREMELEEQRTNK
jgi:hypothetical protein